MGRSKAKFKAWDWDEGKFVLLPSNNIVKAIHHAWNYEFDVYEAETDALIFTGKEDNEFNSELLSAYGIRLIDDEQYRRLQNIKTGEIYKADWES